MLQGHEITIGTPVINTSGARGFVAAVKPAAAKMFSLGTGRMEQIHNDIEIVFDDHISTIGETVIGNWINWAVAARLEAITAEEVEKRRTIAVQAEANARAARLQERQAAEERGAAFRIEAAERMPVWAKAVIVAERIEDQSDSMSDYFGSTMRETVILGFSTHARDLFPELRKAALNYPETADLFDAPESAEHREKYSMGGGFYLKAGRRHSDGWRIQKYKLYQGADSIPVGIWADVSPQTTKAAPAQAAPVSAVAGMAIEEHTHTKHGFQMWVVVLPERVDAETFNTLRDTAKASGGWYSRKWGKTPSGFAFKSQEAAEAFAQGCSTAAPSDADAPQAVAAPRSPSELPAKLRGMADKLQSEIDHKLGDRLTNTPKRQKEAASARQDGARLQRTQQALRLLADHHEAGTTPEPLRGVTTKAAVYDLCRSKIDTSRSGYYDAGIDLNEPAVASPAAWTLWAMLSGPTEAERKAADLRDKIEKLQFANIPGYFPTPAAIVDRMIDAAGIVGGECTVLEPSAGSGAILDRLAERFPEALTVAYECHSRLREVLTAKGYPLAGSDFMEAETTLRFHYILMNPPFEKYQDITHIKRAAAMLAPGGRLVAICANGARQREQLDPLCAEWHDLPPGTFKEAGTGVNTALIVIEENAS